jgi:hypothetical protein
MGLCRYAIAPDEQEDERETWGTVLLGMAENVSVGAFTTEERFPAPDAPRVLSVTRLRAFRRAAVLARAFHRFPQKANSRFV